MANIHFYDNVFKVFLRTYLQFLHDVPCLERNKQQTACRRPHSAQGGIWRPHRDNMKIINSLRVFMSFLKTLKGVSWRWCNRQTTWLRLRYRVRLACRASVRSRRPGGAEYDGRSSSWQRLQRRRQPLGSCFSPAGRRRNSCPWEPGETPAFAITQLTK